MSNGSTIRHVLGFVARILIPGASASTTNLVAPIQQELVDAMGAAAADLAQRLSINTTGMSGPEKVLAITAALIAAAKAQGFKGDVQLLEAVALDVAQAAYRKTLANLQTDMISVGHEIDAFDGFKSVTALVTESVEALAKLAPIQA